MTKTRAKLYKMLVVCILTHPTGSSKYGTTRKNIIIIIFFFLMKRSVYCDKN